MKRKLALLCLGVCLSWGFPALAQKGPSPSMVKLTPTQIKIQQQVYFRWGRATILKRSYTLLAQVAAAMRQHPHLVIRVEGHTGSRGSSRYNLRLSKLRACAVRQFLIKEESIPAKRLECVGYGESRPLYKYGRKRRLNRRTEFWIVKKSKDSKAPSAKPRRPVRPMVRLTRRGIRFRPPLRFQGDSTQLQPEAMAILKQVAQVIHKHPRLRFSIEGHTDSKGRSKVGSIKLTRAQACKVRGALIQMGIAPKRLRCIGYGYTRPLAPNSFERGRQMNRRVEVLRWPSKPQK